MNAGAKLAAKKLDLIVANDVTEAGSGFGADDNRVTLLFADGRGRSCRSCRSAKSRSECWRLPWQSWYE